LTNVTESALVDGDASFTGPGTNYLFWDEYHPTAKVHEIMADTVHQQITPTRIAQITPAGANVQLALVNVPVGLNGWVDSSTNFQSWLPAQSFASTNKTLLITLPASGGQKSFRLRFPFAWTWP
jgi:phospholipase/lecithinase/hemolysin